MSIDDILIEIAKLNNSEREEFFQELFYVYCRHCSCRRDGKRCYCMCDE